MKTRKISAALLIAGLLTATYSYSQETVVASATTTSATEATTSPEGEEKKEEEPKFTLSGSIDVYARTALGYKNGTSGLDGTFGPSTSFSDLKGFGLGMANLIASYAGEKSGFTADLVFGPRGKAAVFGPSVTDQKIINQMYAYLKLGKVTLNLGQFNTFLGYEVISPAVNFHYSTSYLFSWGPFNHTGVRADIDLGNGLVAKLAVMNPTDIVEFNPVDTYTLGGQIGKTSDAGGIWVNFLYGDQDGKLDEDAATDGQASAGNLFQIDVTTGWNLGEKFYLGFNTSMQSIAAGEIYQNGEIQEVDGDATSFFGAAIYPKVTLSESFALGLRAEYFSTKEFHLSDYIAQDAEGKGSVTAFTLSANYKVGGLTIIPEVRMDSASEDTFYDADGNAKKSMTSLTLAAVYKF